MGFNYTPSAPIYHGLAKDDTEWSMWRKHGSHGDIPVTIGGSDIGVVLGLSSYKQMEMLWLEKRDEFLHWKNGTQRTLPIAKAVSNDATDTGHLFEEFVCRRYELDHPGEMIIRQPGSYQHGSAGYEFAFVNPDGVFCDDAGNMYRGFEAKTCHYQNAKEAIRGWQHGIVPESYEAQIRYYMGVLNLNQWVISCAWAFTKDAKADISVGRDTAFEEYMFNAGRDFAESVMKNQAPKSATAYARPEKVKEMLTMSAFSIKKSSETLSPVTLDPAIWAPELKKLKALQRRCTAMNKQCDGLKAQKDAAENRIMKILLRNGALEGVCETPSKPIRVSCKVITKELVDTQRMKKEEPALFERFKYESAFSKVDIKD